MEYLPQVLSLDPFGLRVVLAKTLLRSTAFSGPVDSVPSIARTSPAKLTFPARLS